MLAIFSEFDGLAFAADALDVDSVLSSAALALEGGAFANSFSYKGATVPVADFCLAAAGRAVRPIYSARCMVFKLAGGGFLGLLAEGVISAEEIEDSLAEHYPCACGALTFSKAFKRADKMVRIIEPAKLYAELCGGGFIKEGGDGA